MLHVRKMERVSLLFFGVLYSEFYGLLLCVFLVFGSERVFLRHFDVGAGDMFANGCRPPSACIRKNIKQFSQPEDRRGGCLRMGSIQEAALECLTCYSRAFEFACPMSAIWFLRSFPR